MLRSWLGRMVWLLALLVAVLVETASTRAEDALGLAVARSSSGRDSTVGSAIDGERPYTDRDYRLKKLPDRWHKARLVRTSMDDDYAAAPRHLVVTLEQPAEFAVALDTRGDHPPDWMRDWSATADRLWVDEQEYRIYTREFPAGEVVLGGNDRRQTGARSNYVVLVRPTETVPFPDADFARLIQPLLREHCVGCHGPDVQEGGLRLDIRRRALQGGDTAAAIVPRSERQSELLSRIEAQDKSRRMPQRAEPLAESDRRLLRQWIAAGAPWPDELAGTEAPPDHWAFRPIAVPAPPATHRRDWAVNAIDQFVLDRLERAGLEPSAEADRSTLIRRLTFDLWGLPPTPAEVAAFVNDAAPEAYARLVDRLLSAPQFGERWTRHWLDQARFAESDGYENDNPRPHAWKFRDWVLGAMNADLPFDRFTIEQLAGDLLPEATIAQRVATAFHRQTLHNSAGGADPEEFRTRAVKDRTHVTATVWMGLTFHCAECHSHKYDPISQREYYRLYAFFNNADHDEIEQSPTLKGVERTTHVQRRGNFLDPAAEVQPGVLAVLPELHPRGDRADRLDLARWLVDDRHPLTARVTANSLWQALFGRGLIATPENLGLKGEPPRHPELLDWLAATLRGAAGTPLEHSPWSRKEFVRLVVSSATYRQQSRGNDRGEQIDPDNQLWWRQNRVRLEAEAIRDTALAVSGLLSGEIGGPSIQPPLPRGLGQLSELKNERFQEAQGSPYRRGLYVHAQRTFPYPMFAAFDAPDGNSCQVQRDRSITPLQALMLLNDPAWEACFRALGDRLRTASLDDAARLELGCQLCLARAPEEGDWPIWRQLLDRLRAEGADETTVWQGVARTLLNLDETITRE